MSVKGKRVIWVGPADGSNAKPHHAEAIATVATILPGAVLERAATGFLLNNNAATIFDGQRLLVADKDVMRTKSVDDLWTIDETMTAINPRSGEFINVLVAAGNDITIRDTPMARSATAGHLDIAVTPATVGATSEQVLCFSDEIVNVTSARLVRMRVA